MVFLRELGDVSLGIYYVNLRVCLFFPGVVSETLMTCLTLMISRVKLIILIGAYRGFEKPWLLAIFMISRWKDILLLGRGGKVQIERWRSGLIVPWLLLHGGTLSLMLDYIIW